MTPSVHPGRFVWYELMTPDPAAAKAFYTEVIGWGTQPFEGAPIPYTMWTNGDAPIGGMVEFPAGEGGGPPHWIAHVTVADVDATAARARELGATILMGPESVPDVGRYVVLADPQGAVIAAFDPANEMGPDADAEPGQMSWHELLTTDQEAAWDFYSELFGWEKQEAMDMGEAGVYQMYGVDGHMLGGMYNKSADQPGPAWLYYIRVADLDAAVEKVKGGGGTIVVDPMEVPGGSRIAVGLDPQGAAFGMHQRA